MSNVMPKAAAAEYIPPKKQKSDQEKAMRLLIKLEKEKGRNIEKAKAWDIARLIIASPMAQIVGTVAIAEILEDHGILSGRWAGAIEGGVITMVGLQALKEYGVMGAGVVGLGAGTGALTEGTWEGVKNLLLGGALLGDKAPLTQLYNNTLGKVI